jgi:hypothetical protein
MVVYVKIGKADWSLRLAEGVPVLWKCVVSLVFCASVWYTAWHADRHLAGVRRVRKADFWYIEYGRDRHPLELPWKPGYSRALFLWDALIALTFAIVTADSRGLFHAGTLFAICLSYGTTRYYRKKLARAQRAETSGSLCD